MIDMLAHHDLTVSYSDIADDLHVSGHASSRELMMLIGMTKPRYAMPTGGTYRHAVHYQKLAEKMGMAKDHVLLPENQSIVIEPNGSVHTGETLDLKTVYVESGEIARADTPILERKLMFQEGVVVVLLTTSQAGGNLDIDIIPKGITKFIEPAVMVKIKEGLRKSIGSGDVRKDALYSKEKVSKEVSRLFIEYIGKNPVVIPIIIED